MMIMTMMTKQLQQKLNSSTQNSQPLSEESWHKNYLYIQKIDVSVTSYQYRNSVLLAKTKLHVVNRQRGSVRRPGC